MNRTLDFLNCENGTGGPTGVPTSPPPFFPGEPPGEPPGLTDMPIPVVIFPTKPTTVVVTPRAVITGGGTIVGSPSTTTIEVKPSVATLSSWNFDNAPLCADQGWNEGTATQTSYCHLDTYNSLPYPTSGGNSWWCGANEPSWITPPGYGNNWDQALTLPSVDISTTVDPYIFFQYRINIIPDGDIALLEIFNRNTLNWDIITQISGLQSTWLYIDMPINKAVYGNDVQFRFHVISGPTGSDEDGINTDGAFYVDEITIYDNSNFQVFYFNNGGDAGSHPPTGALPTASSLVSVGPNLWNLYLPYDSRVPPSPSCQFSPIDPSGGILPDGLLAPLISPLVPTGGGGGGGGNSSVNCTVGSHLFLKYDAFVDIPFASDDSYSIEMINSTNNSWMTVRYNMKGQLGRATIAEDLGPLTNVPNQTKIKFTMKTGSIGHGSGLTLDNVDLSCASTNPAAVVAPPSIGGSPFIFKRVQISR